MVAVSVGGVTILDDADAPTDGTLIQSSGATAPQHVGVQGVFTASSSGFIAPIKHNITPSTGRWCGKRFVFGVAQNLTNKLVGFSTYLNQPDIKPYYSIFRSNEQPFNLSSSAEPNYLHLATQFRIVNGGTIYGARFYKTSAATTEDVNITLYSNTGTELVAETLTAANQTESGWQEILFGTPYTAVANTLYRIAYRIRGGYAASYQIFSSTFSGYESGEATQGYFIYTGAARAFPNSTFNNTWYWCDVLFLATGGSATNTYNPGFDNFDTKANRGLVVRLNTTVDSAYAETVIAGKSSSGSVNFDSPTEFNTGRSNWTTHVIDPSQLTITGAFNIADVTSIEFRASMFTPSSQRVYLNKIFSTQEIAVTGGTSPDNPAEFIDLVQYQRSSSINLWYSSGNENQFFFAVPIKIGDGSTATRFQSINKSIVWKGGQTSTANPWRYIYGDSVLGIEINTSASCSHIFTRTQFSISSGKAKFKVYGNSAAVVQFNDCIMLTIGTNTFEVGSFENCIFSGSDKLLLDGASFTNCTISDSSDTVAALQWNGTDDISGTAFNNCDYAIEIATAGTYTLNSNTFTDCVPFNVAATSGTITIEVDANSSTDVSGGFGVNAYTSAGATVVFVLPEPSLLLSGIVDGSRVYVRDTTNSLTLYNQVISGTTLDLAVTAGISLLIRVRNASGSPAYKTYETTAVMPGSDLPIVVNQILDE